LVKQVHLAWEYLHKSFKVASSLQVVKVREHGFSSEKSKLVLVAKGAWVMVDDAVDLEFDDTTPERALKISDIRRFVLSVVWPE
jgi:hypothetical protein